ncbi:helix-turn-helix domain-containing protein [Rosistilla oblonga]|uniref:helix-turn-helix domain-containing protein n=1 Tax=Rosistilla oblonga TaxID=2527990 RepID=UPI003A96CAFA
MGTLKTICDAIKLDNWSANAIAQASGVQQASLHRFCNTGKGLSIESLEKLCEQLDLSLVRRVNFQEWCDANWEDAKDVDWLPAYDDQKSEAWEEYSDEAWPEQVEEAWNEQEEGTDYDEWLSGWEDEAYREWEAEAYPEWEHEYDSEEYQKFYDGCYSQFASEEREKLEAADWIVLVDEPS